ncbi:MAG: hypothetical protein JSW08_00880 [archaeon]|nr:MAG: hypothetical protein JSW08_00880 [archaeon]
MKKIYLYYHGDFDGIASAYLMFHVLKKIGYHPEIAGEVHYGMCDMGAWRKGRVPIKKPACVVDFSEYRPDLEIYFDHHSNPKGKKSKTTKIFYHDPSKQSCFEVILNFAKKKKIKIDLKNLREVEKWAKLIDGALYYKYGLPPIETIKPKNPVIQLALILNRKNIPVILQRLINGSSFEEISKIPRIQKEIKDYLKKADSDLRNLKKVIKKHDKRIVIYNTSNIRWYRFAPFHFFPESSLAVGIAKSKKRGRYYVKASQNPWKNVMPLMRKIKLGEIFKRYGGGGHDYVASSSRESKKDAQEKFKRILEEIKTKLEK